jgi:hypothetical protein
VGIASRGRGRAPDASGAVVIGPGWAQPRRAGLLLAAIVAAVFARSLANGFTYDEPLVLVQAQGFLKSSDYWVLLSKHYFAASLEGTWRPFCTLTYMIDALEFAPATFKAQSILWHIAAAWLVMALARRLLPEAQRRFALVAGLVFALHPVVTETVDNASFREDSLVTFWTLATILLALRGRRRWSLVAFALGLLSKESAIVAPVMLALARFVRAFPAELPPGPPPTAPPTPVSRARRLVGELWPYGVVASVYLVIRFGPMKTAGQYALYPGGSLVATLVGMPVVWAYYLRLLVWPWPLCADYTGYFPFGHVPPATLALSSAIVLAFVALLVVALRRRLRVVAYGLGWFALALGPVSNLMPVPVPAAERFLTLPLVGIALAVAAAAGLLYGRLSRRAWLAARAAGVAVLCVLAVLVNLRHEAWRDDPTLWVDTVAVNPRSCGAQSAIGGTLLSRGIEQRSLTMLRDSVAHQELALQLCSERSNTMRTAIIYTRLGAGQAMLNHLAPARVALQRALSLQPRYALPIAWLGYVEFLSGDKEAAAALLKRAIIDLGPPDWNVVQVAQFYVDKL